MRYFLILLLFSGILAAEEAPETGTLIVTYTTPEEGDYLDRIRFWLKSAPNKQSLYPKESAFLESENSTRKVVIENLPPGNYTLQFLIPNTKAQFEDPIARTVEIAAGEKLRLDVKIKKKQSLAALEEHLSTGKLIVSYEISETFSTLAENVIFRLKDENGGIYPLVINPESTIALNHGKMVTIEDITSGRYTLEFILQEAEGEQLLHSRPLEIREGKTKSVHQEITLDFPLQKEA